MSKAYNEMSYVEVAAIYNDINNIPLDAAQELGLSVAKMVGEGGRILDLGGGAGRISVPIAAHTQMIAIDIEHHMQKASKKLGFDFYLGHKVVEVTAKGKTVTVKAENKKGEKIEFKGDYCLVSIGRRPYTDQLGLENIGITTDKAGMIEVDSNLQSFRLYLL